MEFVQLHHTRAPGNYQTGPRVKMLPHISVMEMAVKFWRVKLPFAVMASIMNNNAMSLILSAHLGWMNELINVPRTRQNEIVYKSYLPESEYRKLLRPEQKTTGWLQDITSGFSKPGNVPLGACSETIPTSRAFLRLLQHR